MFEPPVRQEHLDALCPELRLVVDDATRHGNPAVESWTEFGNGVRLEAPRPVLDGVPAEVKDKLVYKPVDDPHYWLGEIQCREHQDWFVALPYPRDLMEPLPDLDLESG